MSSDDLYTIVATGALQPEHNRQHVSRNLAKLFSVDEIEVVPLLDGEKIFIREGVKRSVAEYYQKKMVSAGLLVEIKAYIDGAKESGNLLVQQDIRSEKERGIDAAVSKVITNDDADDIDKEKLLTARKILKYAAITLAIAFILDGYLSSITFVGVPQLSAGNWIYAIGHIMFIFGGYKYCDASLIKDNRRHLSLLSFVGVALLLLSISRSSKGSAEFNINKLAMYAVLIVAAVWLFGWIGTQNQISEYFQNIEDLALIQANAEFSQPAELQKNIADIYQKIEIIVAKNHMLMVEYEVDNETISEATRAMLDQITYFIDWLRHQQYLQYKEGSKPDLELNNKRIDGYINDIYHLLKQVGESNMLPGYSKEISYWMNGYYDNEYVPLKFMTRLNSVLVNLQKAGMNHQISINKSKDFEQNVVTEIIDIPTGLLEEMVSDAIKNKKGVTFTIEDQYITLIIDKSVSELEKDHTIKLVMYLHQNSRYAGRSYFLSKLVRVGGSLPNRYMYGMFNAVSQAADGFELRSSRKY